MTNKRKTEISEALGEILSQRGLSQYRASKTAGTTQPYMNAVSTGARVPTAGWLNIVAEGLGLSPEERVKLHRAAAKDHGFEIDLSEVKRLKK